MNERITGSVTFWRRNRHWQFLIEAPDWVIRELVDEARERGIFVLNYGGGSNGSIYSTLLGTSPGGSDPYKPADEPLTDAPPEPRPGEGS